MGAAEYDVAPIMEEPKHRYVSLDEVSSSSRDTPVEALASSIAATDLVTADLPLADALVLLSERAWYFIMDRDRVTGILTMADLQQAPVNLVVLGYILAIEGAIDGYIDRLLGQSWQDFLSPQRLQKVKDVFNERRGKNVGINLRACLDLEARLSILSKSDVLRSAIGLSRNRVDEMGEQLKRLRDTLAHGGSIVDVSGDPSAGLKMAQMARMLADQIWESVPSRESHRDV
jgi:hypothetical protein